MSEPKPRDLGGRRRRAILASLVILLVIGAGVITAASEHEGQLRSVDLVTIGALIVLTLILGLRATTNFTLVKRNPALDDELTRANRARAARAGYWALMIASALAFIGGVLTNTSLSEAAPLLLAVGAAGAGIRFVMLEARR